MAADRFSKRLRNMIVSGGKSVDGNGGDDGSDTEARDDVIRKAVTRFVDVVDVIQSRATGPVLRVISFAVRALLIATALLGTFVLLVIAAVRLTDIAIPGNVWVAYLVLSAVTAAGGSVIWSHRRTAADRKAARASRST